MEELKGVVGWRIRDCGVEDIEEMEEKGTYGGFHDGKEAFGV